jgi:hypothetical protein
MAKKKTKTPEQTPWEITSERFVGFIDIMGFKDMVARNSNDTIYKMMRKVSDALRASQSVFGVDYDTDDENGFDINIIMMTYSDSIMIYSRDTSESSLENFLGAIGSLTEDLFKDEIPHKGAVARGIMTIDFEHSIFFGQPLIDAYLLSEELSFYGIVAHASIQYTTDFMTDISVCEYNCPFKNGTAKHFTVLPATFFSDPYEEERFNELIESISRLSIKTSGALRKYIDNTVAYYNSENLRRVEFTKAEEARIDAIDKSNKLKGIVSDDLPF